MSKIEAYGSVNVVGELKLQNRGRFEQDLKHFPACDVVIIIKPRAKRSSEQNRYYWGVVVHEITVRLRELGNEVTPEMVHEFLKGKFNKTTVYAKDDEFIEMAQSTTELNKEEFSAYVEQIKRWAADIIGIYIPDPGTQTQMNFDEV
jgi:hypothetical protein